MTSEAEVDAVVGGVDTHADTIHVAAISTHGRELDDREFPTTSAGYRRALAFLASLGEVVAIGVEGSSSYGSGFTRAAQADGLVVVEVMRPDRSERRRLGKSDPIDAYQVARAVLAGHRTAPVKAASVDGIRALHNARRSAVKARTAAMVQIHHMLITAPASVREKYAMLKDAKLIGALARVRPSGTEIDGERAVLIALKSLANRCLDLAEEHTMLGKELDALVSKANPGLRAVHGIGPDTAAQLLITAGGNPDRLRSEAAFAALAGVAPVQASSGKVTRHRLSRGGDRAANNALYRIAIVRMRCEKRTREFVARQREAGRSTKEIIRILKRAIAREIFRALTTLVEVPQIADLRPARRAKNITLTTVANHFGVWPATISEIERGVRRNDELTIAYREWLAAA